MASPHHGGNRRYDIAHALTKPNPPDVPLCKGCKELKHRLLMPGFYTKQDVTIHSNLAELASCADNCCDLCIYFLREIVLTKSADLLVSKEVCASWKRHADSEELDARAFDLHLVPGRLRLSHDPGLIPRKHNRRDRPTLQYLLDVSWQWLETCLGRHDDDQAP